MTLTGTGGDPVLLSVTIFSLSFLLYLFYLFNPHKTISLISKFLMEMGCFSVAPGIFSNYNMKNKWSELYFVFYQVLPTLKFFSLLQGAMYGIYDTLYDTFVYCLIR